MYGFGYIENTAFSEKKVIRYFDFGEQGNKRGGRSKESQLILMEL